MLRYVVRRLLALPLVLAVLASVAFFIVRFTPGGPFDKEKMPDEQTKQRMMEYYGWDKPLAVQWLTYLERACPLKFRPHPHVGEVDLGLSVKWKGRSVNELIGPMLRVSIALGFWATVIAVAVGLTCGIVAGIRSNSIFDYATMSVSMVGISTPTFVTGTLLVFVLSMKLEWFNTSGWAGPKDVILPAFTLALPFAARIARLTRTGMLEVVNQDYIRTARAKGLSEQVVVVRHALRGALLPVLSFMGPAMAQLMTGSLVVEKIFLVPGIGREFVESALGRDYNLALGLVLVYGAFLILFNLIVDVLYTFFDPRIRYD